MTIPCFDRMLMVIWSCCPIQVFIAPSAGEVRKLELAQFQDQGVPVGKAFTFTVLTHRAK